MAACTRPMPASGRNCPVRASRPPTSWIQGPADHGAGQIVNLFGIESPGLTASLAIADHVVELLSLE